MDHPFNGARFWKFLWVQKQKVFFSHVILSLLAHSFCFRFDCVFYSRTGKIVIVVECDENAHATYPEKCEWTRPFAACDIFQPKPVLFVRWNPDAWKVNGTTIRVSKKQKMEVLWKTIQPYAEEAASSSSSSASSSEFGPLKVISLYYPSITQNPVCKLTKEELEGKMDVLFS